MISATTAAMTGEAAGLAASLLLAVDSEVM